jgi:hypothetical protein
MLFLEFQLINQDNLPASFLAIAKFDLAAANNIEERNRILMKKELRL